METGNFSLMRHTFLELAQFSNGELFEDNKEQQHSDNDNSM